MCQVAAIELGASGVRVNSIRPGLVDTDLVGFVTAGGEVLDDYLACMPIARVGTVEDIAAMARFLVGPESTWLTGQAINVDGGHSLTPRPELPRDPRAALRRRRPPRHRRRRSVTARCAERAWMRPERHSKRLGAG